MTSLDGRTCLLDAMRLDLVGPSRATTRSPPRCSPRRPLAGTYFVRGHHLGVPVRAARGRVTSTS
jgi:hypothetical protein